MKYINHIFLLISILSFAFQAKAQDATRADSLFAIWEDRTNSDDIRVEAFYQRFNPFLTDEGNNPEAKRWAPGLEEVLGLVQKTGKEEYMGRFLCLISGAQIAFTKELDKGCATGKEALRVSLKLKDYNSIQASLYLLKRCPGIDLIPILENELSLDTLVVEEIPFYTNLTMNYYAQSRLPDALELAQRVISFAQDIGPLDHASMSQILAYAGSTHSIIGNHEEAEHYLLSSLEQARNSNIAAEIGASFIDLAFAYIRKKDLEKANIYLDSAMIFMEDKQGCEACMAKAQGLRASVENRRGNFKNALEDLLKLKSFYDRNKITKNYTLGIYYSELSNAYLGLEQYESAIAIALTGIDKTEGNLYSSLQSYENIYKAYAALGNDKNAFEFYQKYINARDKITQIRNSQQVTKQEVEFQYEQQRLSDSLRLEQQKLQQELLFQQEIGRQKNNRNIFLVFGLIAAIIAFGIYSRYRFAEKTKKQLEENNKIIEAEKRKAEASEKAKHQFLANMSHEIRTPMNAIKGMTDILLRRTPDEKQLEYLNGIKQSSDSLLVIINDILDISKIEAGKIDLEEIPFSISGVIRNVKTIMQLKADEKGLLLKVKISENIPNSVIGDPTRLHQVLLNLTGNAIKFTTKGMVTIQLKAEEIDAEHVMVKFCVSDTGVGIGKDRMDKIFESFEQAYSDTTRKFGGTGLGLSISKKLIEIQNGKIWAESKKGKGSQFYFTIPYKIDTMHENAENKKTDLKNINNLAQLKGIKILLVEDNRFNAIVAQEELDDAIEEVKVDVAENGVIAIEKVSHGDIDIVLMDVQMPVMNGYEATHAIRNLSNGKAKTPIIAMTANVMKEEVERCYEAGMDDFIGKPFNTDDLIQKIQKLLSTTHQSR